jgi:L-lysine 6-transaminase
MHLRHAFHGRSGYTISLTNTDPVKVDRYPMFDWPRIETPVMRFPVEDHAEELERAEAQALEQAEAAFAADPHGIACFIAEPIQSEGGDNHLSAGYLLAMQEMCQRHDALFVLDEVQTGAGVTGSPWCYQQLGLEPDVVAFGKKVQLGGIMAGRRVDLVPDNVFNVAGRINSTWGGNLTDMVRSRRLLELAERTDAFANAATVGDHLLGRLEALASRFSGLVDNARGRGLLCAIDLPTGDQRDQVITDTREQEHVIVLACGPRTIRFRPSLAATVAEVDLACDALTRVLERHHSSTGQ